MNLRDEMIYVVGIEAGDRSMRKAGRKAWNRADRQAAATAASDLFQDLGADRRTKKGKP